MRRVSNVYKDEKRGTWFYAITLGIDQFGRRVQRSKKGFKTQTEAKKALEEAKRDYENSGNSDLKGIKFKNYYENYFFPWYKLGTVEKTYVKTDNALRRAIDFFGDIQVEKIRPIHIQDFHQYLATECFVIGKNKMQRHLSNNYIKQIFNKLTVVFQRAIALEIIKENPIDSIGKLRTDTPEVKFWTYGDFLKVYQTDYLCDFYESFYKRLMRFLFVTGLRCEEVLALQWSDIDYLKKVCKVNKSIYIKTRTNFEFGVTKSKSSIRSVSLDDATLSILKEWQLEQKEIGDIDFVFSYDGLPPSPKTFLNRLQKLAEVADVGKIHIHGLRHSHVAYLINQNKNIYAISKRLGHSSVKTTLDKYGHLYPETDRTLADEFSDLAY
ncbi:site-specific integrase [Enterococcus hulanensis]|uniref:site-specific integrase n=1 Tax=Enterococcus hulanensis TaxID=2559929 RepID=UPI001A8DE265|nr:tyrosine-type recombinase/integrase [Enterococcus hulanensis]MBO0458160.1 site-specific integrase [Enterococcus hulanensis]